MAAAHQSLKTLLLALVCLGLLLGQTVGAEQKGPKVSVPLLCSYQGPPGWFVRNADGQSNPVCVDDAKESLHHPQISISSSSAPLPLAEFIQGSLDRMKKLIPSTEVVEQQEFVTAAGVKGIRMVVTNEVEKTNYKSIFYFFDAPYETKLMVVAGSPAKAFGQNEALFDAALKTLVIE